MAFAHLQSEGYVVVDVISAESTKSFRDAIRSDLSFDPYFCSTPCGTPDVLTMGGFAALATPHSFHIQPVRDLCLLVDREVAPKVFADYLKVPGNLIAQHKDRTMHRTPSQTPSRESWHRDESPGTDKGVIFGGWINLSTTSDTMSLCPRTHSLTDTGEGFATIPKERHAYYKDLSVRVEVKPGQWIIFYENIVHEVFSPSARLRRERGLLTRLFLGYELTRRTTVLDPELLPTLKNLETPRIKSGQQPRVYSRMHLVFHVEKVAEWSLNVHDRHCFEYTVKSGKRAGQVYRIAKACPSRAGFPSLCAPYTEEELAMFVPHTYTESLESPHAKHIRLCNELEAASEAFRQRIKEDTRQRAMRAHNHKKRMRSLFEAYHQPALLRTQLRTQLRTNKKTKI